MVMDDVCDIWSHSPLTPSVQLRTGVAENREREKKKPTASVHVIVSALQLLCVFRSALPLFLDFVVFHSQLNEYRVLK